MRTVILLLLFSLSVTGKIVAQRMFSEESVKDMLPRKYINYRLARDRFELADTNLVSTHAVYIQDDEDYPPTECGSYIFMRFYSDGWVYFSFTYRSYPSVEEFNDLSYGRYGRYIIDEHGELVVELYMDRQEGVKFLFGRSSPDGIQFYANAFGLHKIFINYNTGGGHYIKAYTKLRDIPR